MPLGARIPLVVILLAVAGYCLFGFLATYEPSDRNFLPLRIAYGAIGVAAFLTAVGLIWPRRKA